MKINQFIVIILFFSLNKVVNSQTPSLSWVKQFGGTSGEGGNSIAVDANGNIYTVGTFSGTTDFDPSTDPNSGTYNLKAVSFDVFVSKLDPNGNFVWAKQLGVGNGFAIALDEQGNVYTTGRFTGGDFDPGPNIYNLTGHGNTDIFVSKLDANGNFVWAKSIGGTSSDEGYALSVNSIGNVGITGFFKNTVDFDPGTGTNNLTAGFIDIFVLMLDKSGDFLWAKRMGGGWNGNGNSGSSGSGIGFDNIGNVYTTGYFSATGDFDPGIETYNLTGGITTDIFISKLDVNGNFVWAKQFVDALGTSNAITVDKINNLYITGSFSGTGDFNPSPNGTFNMTGSDDIFITKLNFNGDLIWAKQFSGTWGGKGNSIAIDTEENVYTTGEFYGNGNTSIDFDPGIATYNLTSAGDNDVFVSKLDANGNFVWAIKSGNSSIDDGPAIAIDENGSIYSTGFFYGSVDFDPGNETSNLTSIGSTDVYIRKLCQIEIPSITGLSSFCQGSSTTLTASIASSYLWNNGETTQSIVVSTPGNYKVTVSNSSGCKANSTNVTVLGISLPTVTANNTTICNGQSATLTATGAVTYVWSNGMTGSTISVSPSTSTVYTVTGTASGCNSLPISAQVTVNPLPNLIVSSDTICSGQTATLSASGAATYIWSNGMTGSSISVNPTTSTTYSLTGTTLGCNSLPISTQVTVNSNPNVNLGADVTLQQGQQVVLDATGAGLTYLWSTGEITPAITVTIMGTYSVTVTNSLGCSSTDEIILNVITSVDDHINKYKITISPNPTIDLINVRCQGSPIFSIELLDNLGRVIHNENSYVPEESVRTINIDKCASGTYFLKILGEDFTHTVKIVKI